MNLDEIQNIVNSPLLSDDIKKAEIINSLAKDDNVLSIVLKILDSERQQKKELLSDINLLLSKAHIGLEDPKYNKDGFMQAEILEFYSKGLIGHCFKKI